MSNQILINDKFLDAHDHYKFSRELYHYNALVGVFAKDVTTEFDTPMPRNIFDEAGRKRLEQERLARKAMEESGMVEIDEETGEVTAVDPPSEPVKVSAAKDPLESTVDDSGAAEQAPGLLKEEIEEALKRTGS